MDRIDFVYTIDVSGVNPNGDPNLDNMPRMNPMTRKGYISDVCEYRKIRNVLIEMGHPVFYRSGVVLNDLQSEMLSFVEKDVTGKMPKSALVEAARKGMCKKYTDIRMFGAVMSTKANCGNVTGPIKLSRAVSVEPITPVEETITRDSVTNRKDLEKERTMGSRSFVPHALYLGTGTITPRRAEETGLTEKDLGLFWNAFEKRFYIDSTSARPGGSMSLRNLVTFTHSSPMGDAPQHQLFEAVKVNLKEGLEYSEKYSDYEITLNEGAIDTNKIKIEVRKY